MGTQENDKKVLIYFYYLAITRQKEASDTSTYDIAQITNAFQKCWKYNHVRNEINTETMEPLGTRKQRRDGDEEKTHLCIRLAQG